MPANWIDSSGGERFSKRICNAQVRRIEADALIFGNYIRKSHRSISRLRSRRKRGRKTEHEGEASPFRSRQQSCRAAALPNRPAAGADMTRRPGLAHLHGEERWRWPLRRPVKSMRSLNGTFVYNSLRFRLPTGNAAEPRGPRVQGDQCRAPGLPRVPICSNRFLTS